MSVKVAVRVRPFNKREIEMGKDQLIIEMEGKKTLITDPNSNPPKIKDFAFDYSFWSHDQFKTESNGYLSPINDKYDDQQKVFNILGTEILDNALLGYHCCLFAYG